MKKQYIVFMGVMIVIAVAIYWVVVNQQVRIDDDSSSINENNTEIKIIDETKENIDSPITDSIINNTLNKIELNAKNNTYSPTPREWIASGPLQIDRSKYVLGEKVFMRFGGISPTEKGQIVFLRQLNDTHYSVYLSIPFDGIEKSAFNMYFEPKLSKINNICTKEDLVGKWAVVLRGTNYPNLNFDVVDQIIPGDEEKFKPVC